MKLRVVFTCRTCEHINKQYLGMPNFELKETEFYSLTDAYEHVLNASGIQAPAHEVVAELKEDE